MSQSVIYLLIALGLAACVVAVVYIRRHLMIIRQAKVQQEEQDQATRQRYEERRAYLIESIQVIAKAVGSDEKLSNTEACMRLTSLLESFAPQLLQQAEFSVIQEVYNRTQHIPIMAEWKALSKQAQWKYKKRWPG